jgi:thymidylate synthase
MFKNFSAGSADEIWRALVYTFREGKCSVGQPSRAGDTRELLHATLSISEPKNRWVVSRNPSLNLAFALAEVVWIVTGRNDSAFLNFFNSQLPQFAGICDAYHGAYGYRLRKGLGIDQLSRAFDVLQRKPHSRQVVLQIWDGRIDFPDELGNETSADIPCNVIALLKVRGQKLEWTQILRSNDLFRGLPYNIVQFTTLQEILAGWLGLEVGHYNQLSDSLHVYERDFHHIDTLFRCEPEPNTDSLSYPKSESENAFSRIAGFVDRIINPTVTSLDLLNSALSTDLPNPFKNMLLVLAAEGVRRRKSPEIARKLISECTNPVYRQMFSRWIDRAHDAVSTG